MTAEINIVTSEKDDALLLPTAAFDGSKLLTLDGDNKIVLLEVETGIKGPRATEVLKGITGDSRVVFPYNPDLAEGQKVRPIPGDGK